MLTAEQLAWSKKLEKLFAAMPEGIEIIVGNGDVSVMEEGLFKREISSTDIDMLLEGGTLVHEQALHSFNVNGARVIPNSESI